MHGSTDRVEEEGKVQAELTVCRDDKHTITDQAEEEDRHKMGPEGSAVVSRKHDLQGDFKELSGEEPSPAATVIEIFDEQDDKQFIMQSNNVDAVFVARATADRERYKFAVESLKTEIVLNYQEIEKLKTHIKEDHLSKISSIRGTIQSYEKALEKLWEVVNLHKTCYAKEVEESEQLRRVNGTLEAEVRNLKDRITQLEGFGKEERPTRPTTDTRDQWVESEDEPRRNVSRPALQYPVAILQSAKKPAKEPSQLDPLQLPSILTLWKAISFKDSIRDHADYLMEMKRIYYSPSQFKGAFAGNLRGKNKEYVESSTNGGRKKLCVAVTRPLRPNAGIEEIGYEAVETSTPEAVAVPTFAPMEINNDLTYGKGHLPDDVDPNSAYDIFRLFFTDDILDTLAENTNLNAQNSLEAASHKPFERTWKPTTKEELRAYIAVYI
ncbi:MAG: hypothetical protein Q9168_006857 [Polycauliona sp. 1 TL-2023]